MKSNLYLPAQYYDILTKEHFLGLDPEQLVATLLPSKSQIHQIPTAACKFGNVPKGRVILWNMLLMIINVLPTQTFL